MPWTPSTSLLDPLVPNNSLLRKENRLSKKLGLFFYTTTMRRKYSLSLILIFFILYRITVAPGITWAYDSADSGDFLAALATGGVPHPGGYPTYLLFATLFTKLPIGELAFRTNLFSLLSMLGAIVLAYNLVEKLTKKPWIAVFTALFFGSLPLVWSQALITEVYASLTLLCLLTLFLLLPKRETLSLHDFLGGLALGLALGNHLTAIFLAPLLLLKNTNKYLHEVSLRFMGLLTGLSVFLVIPLRASNQAPVNWGNAINWQGFWWLISGQMYQDRLSHFSISYLYKATGLWSQFLLDQITLIGLATALIYIVVFFQADRLHFASLWLALVYSVFSILYYSPDSYIYLILPFFSFSLWIGLGLERLWMHFPRVQTVILTFSLLLVIVRALSLIPRMDISADHQAEIYTETVLDSVPPNAILLTSGDEPTFSLWYYHYALGQRPDVAIVSTDLVSYPWYLQALQNTYPNLTLPTLFFIDEWHAVNPTLPLCELERKLTPEWICFYD